MMENTDLLKSQLEIDSYGATHLLDTARWGKFLAITGFIFTGIMVLGGLVMSMAINKFSNAHPDYDTYQSRSILGGLGPFLGVLYMTIGVLYFFPCLFLFRFATKMKAALAISDQDTLNEALNQHRRMYKFVGILTMIVLGFYAIILLFGGIAAIFAIS